MTDTKLITILAGRMEVLERKVKMLESRQDPSYYNDCDRGEAYVPKNWPSGLEPDITPDEKFEEHWFSKLHKAEKG